MAFRPECKIGACTLFADHVVKLRALQESLDDSRVAVQTLGEQFRGRQTDASPVRASLQYVETVCALKLPLHLRHWLIESQAALRLTQLKPLADAAGRAMSGLGDAVAELQKMTPVDWLSWIRVPSPLEAGAAELQDHARRCASDPEGLQLLIDDARLDHEMRSEGLGPLIDLLKEHRSPFKELPALCRRVIYQSIARTVIANNPALANFTGERHEGYRTQFRELDRKLMRLRQAKIASDLAQCPVEEGSGTGPRSEWTDKALIYNEVAKQKRHISIRSLLDRAGKAVQQLMPCWMMSPLSIAQYLKPGGLKFDLVIMDEASQLRPEDAVGAIARSGQVVIVGDPKQLPPTNFFMGGSSESMDDNGPVSAADEQSILDAAMSILRPVRLKWHYRSRHASLIAFSNKEFYDSELVIFPSPQHHSPDFGVRYVHVSEGRYRGSVNAPEAQQVAAEAVEYALRHPERSLGIVTLNQPQTELVSLEIDRLAAERPEFEVWRKKQEATLEPFFVKNLENVQGDERDTIFISTVYGRDEEGNFHQRFGPINNQGGHRRLNVLFTRAKCQIMVFSTMDPGDIRADESSSWGVRALKGFLKFARDGSLDIAVPSGRAPDSPFEVAVADALRKAGFEVVPQVGVVGYFIDMAVRHPEKQGEFALGIECDGAMYHSTKSARDRDRLRQEVLERLNWRIHRIWSLDWYRHPRRETERLVQAVREAIKSL